MKRLIASTVNMLVVVFFVTAALALPNWHTTRNSIPPAVAELDVGVVRLRMSRSNGTAFTRTIDTTWGEFCSEFNSVTLSQFLFTGRSGEKIYSDVCGFVRPYMSAAAAFSILAVLCEYVSSILLVLDLVSVCSDGKIFPWAAPPPVDDLERALEAQDVDSVETLRVQRVWNCGKWMKIITLRRVVKHLSVLSLLFMIIALICSSAGPHQIYIPDSFIQLNQQISSQFGAGFALLVTSTILLLLAPLFFAPWKPERKQNENSDLDQRLLFPEDRDEEANSRRENQSTSYSAFRFWPSSNTSSSSTSHSSQNSGYIGAPIVPLRRKRVEDITSSDLLHPDERRALQLEHGSPRTSSSNSIENLDGSSSRFPPSDLISSSSDHLSRSGVVEPSNSDIHPIYSVLPPIRIATVGDNVSTSKMDLSSTHSGRKSSIVGIRLFAGNSSVDENSLL